MQLDASDLVDFYEAPIGQLARRMISRRVRVLWPSARGSCLLGYGFAVPYLRPYLADAERVVSLMPAQQGVVAWPAERPLAALCDEDALPFADAFFDRILVVHGLEGADATRPLLRQLWRVLAPEGRLLLIVPNRTELDRLLRGALFEPLRWDRALYLPPLRGRSLVRSGNTWERILRRTMPGLSGVHLVEAGKSLYGATPVPVGRVKRQWSQAHQAPATMSEAFDRISHSREPSYDGESDTILF